MNDDLDLVVSRNVLSLLGRHFAGRYIGIGVMAFGLISWSCAAKADDAQDYVAQVRKTFEHLFVGRHLAPQGGACGAVPGRCELLLEKLSSSDFSFVATLERSARHDMPMLHLIQMRCRKVQIVHDEFDQVPANATKGFAVYLMPLITSSFKDQKIYVLRAEDYVSESHKADILSDGLFITVAYPACHVLKGLPITKSHNSPYEPATPNPELLWLSEPIVLDGKGFILSMFANNGMAPNPPHYLLQLMSVVGFAGSGGEAYTFVAK